MIISLLGGAGLMGQGIVRDLISEHSIINIDEIRVFDFSAERLDALAATFSDPRIKINQTDISDATQLINSIKGADLCINAVPTLAGHQMEIFESALSAKVNYMDLGGLGVITVEQLKQRERFKEAGVTAVIGVGGDPGMSNVLCRVVADELDEIDKINLYWAAEFTGAENPLLVPPYSISTVLAEYSKPSTQFLNGKHVTCSPRTGVETLSLPEPWGECEFMYSPHSEPLTVPLAQGIADKGIREFTWKLHLPLREHEAWIGLIKAGFGDFDDPIIINGSPVKPLDLLERLIQRNIERNTDKIPAQNSHEIHFAIGTGRKDGQPTEVRCEVIVRPNPLYDHYVDAGTSMNASIAAQLLLLEGGRPGVWAPEEFYREQTYIPELEKRKFEVLKTVRSV